MQWLDAITLERLDRSGKTIVRHDGGQILLIAADGAIFAVDNRCPHEGYPLAEGALDGCTLTCHWHHWKFDLASGRTLVGEDRLRHYPVRVRDGQVQIDLTPPDRNASRRRILDDLETALRTRRQGRILREAARYLAAGGDHLDLVRHAVAWAHERLEDGTTHAIAVTPDWLALAARPETTPAERLVALGEILGHIADDAFGQGLHPFADDADPKSRSWNPAAFLDAIETENEAAAIHLIRAAPRAGLAADDLRPILARAALNHYADFGHSLIYTIKTVDLIDTLGPGGAAPLLALLVRSLIRATREDLLPEFATYQTVLDAWGRARTDTPALAGASLRGKSVRRVLPIVAGWGARHPPEQIFEALVGEAAWMMLHANASLFDRTDVAPAQSVNWLDFTHAITFAEAGWRVAGETPALWPSILLQLACFIGRNAGFVDAAADASAHGQDDDRASLDRQYRAVFDHGRDRFIISAHVVKTLCAADAMATILPAQAHTLTAALNRFVAAPMKGRHALRAARQALDLIGPGANRIALI
ncbi:Rieske (2Fe-2S) protein [Acidiphilium iwatense]|uniref:Rieske (2Fe-2S) protein n=1 Tax=Acidiphilium iwatense TaxID=768198 RepID=A0ABS9DUQ1_9PROT|nr:Rieske (2Fe-2S) protein [Acidiphilium iwatense]MCF3946457.1 Rieske (2Fe-2S) protein [Acidiphilium iwatense]